VCNGPPIGNDPLGFEWSRDCHVTQKGQGHDPNIFGAYYLDNGWRHGLGANGVPIGNFLLFLMCNCAVNWCDKLRFLHLYSNNNGTVYGLSTINFAIDVRWTTGQLHFLAIVQARRFSLFGHIARMPDETDVKKILTAVPLENWRRSPIYPSYYMDEDYPARPEIQKPYHERSNRHGWRVMSTFGAMHS